jgi:hypothetical protein
MLGSTAIEVAIEGILVRFESLVETLEDLKSDSKENAKVIKALEGNQIDNANFMQTVRDRWDAEKKFRDRCWTAAVVIFSPLIAICWAWIKEGASWLFHLFAGKVKT